MRIGFRTNIDEELVAFLKKNAIERKLNANDILESLLREYMEIEMNCQESIDFISQDEMVEFYTYGALEALKNFFYKYHIDTRGFFEDTLELIIRSLLVNLYFKEKE